MSNKILLTVVVICLLLILAIILYPKQNLHEPFSKEEIVNIIDPPLDTTNGLNNGLYDKYHYTPTFQNVEMQLLPKMIDVMEFAEYGNVHAFVFTHPNDSLVQKSERPIYIVEKKEQFAFTKAITQNDTLIFRQSGKQTWTYLSK